MKKCFECENSKELEAFSQDKSRKDGLQPVCKACRNSYYIKNKEKIKLQKQKYREENKELIQKQRRKSYFKNKEQMLIYHKSYYSRPEIKKRKNEQEKYKLSTNPNYKILRNLRIKLCGIMKGRNKSMRTIEFLGCSVEELWEHLKSKFQPGMTVQNYGRNGWHMDHIIPCVAFDFSDPKQQRKCFHYSNLQPLWAKDNLSKGDKILPEYKNLLNYETV